MSVRIKLRRDTSANWKTVNPVPVEGEPCFETDTGKLKIGDGINPYNSLAYFAGGGGGGTDISASLPLVIEDGVLKLQIDGQTIQLNTEGQLSANLDELGNEVNTLSRLVTSLQDSKQDKLTAGDNITITDDGTISAVSSGSSGDVTAAGDNTFTGANTFTGINTFDKIVLPNGEHSKGIFLEGNHNASISGSNGKMTIRYVSDFETERCKIESGHLRLGDYEDIGVEAITALYEESDGSTREVDLLIFYNATASLSLGDSSIPLNIEGSTIEVNGNDLTKIIDGQWVPVNITVAENITYPTEAEAEYDLSSFLPTDTYDYEVLIRGYVKPSATANKYVNLYIGSPLLGIKAGITGTRTQGAYVAENVGSCIIPVDTTRKIQVATSTSANAEGSYTIWACAYRRIGTNA